jgi:hypothetical protein
MTGAIYSVHLGHFLLILRQVTVSRAALVTYISNAVRDRDKLDSNSLNNESKFYPIKKLITSFNSSIISFHRWPMLDSKGYHGVHAHMIGTG